MVIHAGKRLQRGYKREKKYKLKEWSETKIIFTSEDVSPILGNFKTKYSPHYVKLFQLAERRLTFKMYAKWASQSGKSLFVIIVVAHKLDQNPANVIYAQPIKEDIPKILTLKINPTLKSIPDLWKKFEEYSTEEKFRTKDAMKRVPGGAMIVSGSSVKERKSLTSPLVAMDELGEFEKGAAKEFTERTKSFSRFNPLVIGASTITHPKDEICSNHDLCEVQIEWHFECRQCDKNFYPGADTFKVITKADYAKMKDIETDKVKYSDYTNYAKLNVHVECPHCFHKIYEKERTDMIFNDEMDWYIINADGSNEKLIVENLTTEATFGIDMNSLGSYFAPLEVIAMEYVEAMEDEELLDKFFRGWLNKFYEVKFNEIDENDILLLGNDLKKWIIPANTYKIYMGVDTQKDHFWYEVKAFCYGAVSHTIAWGRVETFAELEDIWIEGQYIESDGETYSVSKMGIDRRGYNQDGVRRTDEVDEFVQYMVSKYKNGDENRIYATEGHANLTGDKATITYTKKDESDSRDKIDIKVLKLSNIYLKNKLQRAIERTIIKVKAVEDKEGFEYESNLFYIDSETIEADMKDTISTSYTRQITAEVFDFARLKNGKLDTFKTWINPKKKDNHILDTSVICYGFAEVDKISLKRIPDKTVDIANAISGLTRLGN